MKSKEQIVRSTKNYCECSYCGGLRGDVRLAKGIFRRLEKIEGVTYVYNEQKDILYVKTKAGFWMIYMKEELGYLLYHKNDGRRNSSEKDSNHTFHRQHDVKPTDSLPKLLDYIVAHDKAKLVILDDYKKLPKHTKRQRYYYKKVQKKEKRKEMRRLDSLFDLIERQNPEIKTAYRDAAYC